MTTPREIAIAMFARDGVHADLSNVDYEVRLAYQNVVNYASVQAECERRDELLRDRFDAPLDVPEKIHTLTRGSRRAEGSARQV
jgi:hypothetical protein